MSPSLIVNDLGGETSLTSTLSITTTETVVIQARLQPGQLQVGTSLRLYAHGSYTASASGSITPALRVGTAGTTADTTLANTTAIGSVSAAAGFRIEGSMTVRSIGSSGTVVGSVGGIINNGSNKESAQTATVAINTTILNYLSLTLLGAGTSPSITVVEATIEIVKP